MTALIGIVISGILTNNIILNQAIGICPFLGVSKKLNSSLGMGLAVTFVITVASVVCYFIYNFILAPLSIGYLQTIVFILIIASLVQLLDIVLKKTSPTLYTSLGVYLALITTNCAVLFTANYGVTMSFDLLYTAVNAVCVGIGFTLALLLMAGIREKLTRCHIPRPFNGFPIALIIAGIMSLAFLGFAGFTI